MDETSLRAELERALVAEPPLGPLVDNSLRAGRKLRQRRRALSAVAAVAAVGLIAAIVPVADGSLADGSHHRQQPSATARASGLTTAYIATGSEVVPLSLATNTLGTPIRVPAGSSDPFVTSAAASPSGRTIYEVGAPGGGVTLTPIDTATNTAGPTITINSAYDPAGFALAPDGKTAYLSTPGGLFRISIAANTASKVTGCRRCGYGRMAFTPNGKFLYVITSGAPHGARTVTVIRTGSNAPLTRITLPLPGNVPGFPYYIAITPNGKTAYVVDTVGGAKPGVNSVVPISVAANTPLAPIKIWASGFSEGIAIAPDGRTAYVLTSRAVTAIDTATNQAEATISLPESAGYAYNMVLAPDGKTLYVLTPRGVVPIRTASGTVLPTIKVPHLFAFTVIAITPDSGTVFVGAAIKRRKPGHPFPSIVTAGVVPISTATGTAGHFINLGTGPFGIAFAGKAGG